MPEQASRLRRALDALYYGAAVLAACFMVGICALMLLQVAGRELGMQLRGADDLTAWFCAASAFLALAHTFKRGELVRVGLWIERLPQRPRWHAELFSLGVAALFVGYMGWAVTTFVYQSLKFHESAQGLIPIPIWIPQSSFVLGTLILLIAILDELLIVLRRRKPTYQIADEERRARGDFTETL
jgi:TRAP-type C4-dicarboxylate transport system permease small subunit